MNPCTAPECPICHCHHDGGFGPNTCWPKGCSHGTTDPVVAYFAKQQMQRMAAEPCECEARQRRTLPGAEFPLRPEDVKCTACRAKEALERESR